jgi:hypothetical protein
MFYSIQAKWQLDAEIERCEHLIDAVLQEDEQLAADDLSERLWSELRRGVWY